MELHIEHDPSLAKGSVQVRCNLEEPLQNQLAQHLQEFLQGYTALVFYLDNAEHYLPLGSLLFFETENDNVYAHTKDALYRVKQRLYELEELLPSSFMRISKSAIINVRQIASVQWNLTSTSLIQFFDTHKKIYVSRHYAKPLRLHLQERSQHET